MEQQRPCPYCDSLDSQSSFGNPSDPMRVCKNCNAWFIEPMPNAQEMSRYYSENADLGIAEDLRDWREGTSQWKWYEFLAARISSIAEKKNENKEDRTIADVGAGGLELSLQLASRFPGSHITAFDLHDLNANIDLGDQQNHIDAEILDLNNLSKISSEKFSSKYDLVICISVIEHVIDPSMLMAFLYELTAPHGVIYIVGPNSESMARKLMGKRWPYYTPDQHLTIPSSKSLELAVNRIAPGSSFEFKPLLVRYSINYLMKYLGISASAPKGLDIALALPAGAFELIWWKD